MCIGALKKNCGQGFARFRISTPVVLAGPHTVIFSKQGRKLLLTLLLCQNKMKKNFYKKKDCYIAAFLKIVDKFTDKLF